MTDTSPRLGLKYMVQGQESKEITYNEFIQRCEKIVQPVVESMTLTAPPTGVEGKMYVIAAGATGAWSGKSGQITQFLDGAWQYYAPFDGLRVWNKATGIGMVYRISAWDTELSNLMTFAGGNMTGAINENLVTLPSAVTMNIGAAPANYIIVTGTTNISAFDSAQPGTKRKLRFSAGLTVISGANMLLPGGGNIAVVAGDVMEFVSGGGGLWRCTDYQPWIGYVKKSGTTLTLTNTDGAIGGLTIGATYSQSEVQALRDGAETLADDVRAMKAILTSLGVM